MDPVVPGSLLQAMDIRMMAAKIACFNTVFSVARGRYALSQKYTNFVDLNPQGAYKPPQEKKMNKILMFLIAGAFAQTAHAYTLADLAGTYRVTSDQIPSVANLVTLNANGDITLKEVSDRGEIVCKGQSKFEDNLLRSIVKCADPTVFYRQQIDLSAVRNLKKFKAPVSSDLFGMTLMMDFQKIAK